MQRRVNECKEQGHAYMTLCSSTVNLLDEKLFRALAREAELRVSELNAQKLANTAWAFATVNMWNEKLFRALA